jgi:hypothetical protein
MRRYEGTRLDVQEIYVQVLDEVVKGIRCFLGNKFKYDMYTSADKFNR